MTDRKNTESLPLGFRDVDATIPDKFIRCLDTLQNMNAVRTYKGRALDLLELNTNSSALDVACGLGDDVVRMKARCNRAVGVDRSKTLIDRAKARHEGACEFGQAEADKLPFADGTFDAVRIDRSLQHIADPGRVLREMARVAKPGGIVLCAEPDWGTFLIGGPYSDMTERIQREWIRGFQNPRIGRELSSLLADAGVVDLGWEGYWLPTVGFEDSDLLFGIEETAHKVSRDLPEALPWLESYRRSEAYAGVLILLCWGRKG